MNLINVMIFLNIGYKKKREITKDEELKVKEFLKNQKSLFTPYLDKIYF